MPRTARMSTSGANDPVKLGQKISAVAFSILKRREKILIEQLHGRESDLKIKKVVKYCISMLKLIKRLNMFELRTFFPQDEVQFWHDTMMDVISLVEEGRRHFRTNTKIRLKTMKESGFLDVIENLKRIIRHE